MARLALVILTQDSAATLGQCIESAQSIADSVLVVDSYSTDESVEVAREHGATVLQRPFVTYAQQRNWAAERIDQSCEWILHLDSDEYLTPSLAAEIAARIRDAHPATAGFIMRRKIMFLGREMRHGGLATTWHLRLYRVGRAQCEDRHYDQHFVADGPIQQLEGFFVDDNRSSLELWTQRHNRWSSAEAHEYLGVRLTGPRVVPRLTGSPMGRKRWLKERFWPRLPLLWRAYGYFIYRYFLRLGFLDGREGLVFHTLQGLWFRFLVDSKVWERWHLSSEPETVALLRPRSPVGGDQNEP
jgi:glycosyltransferase involved in cell wall biosynthesis